MSMNKDKQFLLLEELKEYEKHTELSDDERAILHEWVNAGNSVHENASLAEDGHGHYLDFIDVYREEQDMLNTLSTMNDEEKEDFIAEMSGTDTIRTLRRKNDDLFFKSRIYETVLIRHHLLEEAEQEMKDARARAMAFKENMPEETRLLLEGGELW